LTDSWLHGVYKKYVAVRVRLNVAPDTVGHFADNFYRLSSLTNSVKTPKDKMVF